MINRIVGGRWKFYLVSVLGIISISSCSFSKKDKELKIEKLEAQQVVQSYEENLQNPKFISSNIRIKLETKDRKTTFSAKLRMEKDNKIWVNISFLGISMARAIVTPDSLIMYERQNDTYFKGDYSLISNLLGTELDFEKIQSILLGKSLLEIKSKEYKTIVSDKTYLLEYEKNRKLTKSGVNNGDLIKRFWIEPNDFSMRRQLIAFPDRSNTIIVSNDSFVETENGFKLPEKINLQVIGDVVTIVNIEFSDIKTDSIKAFPFRIPKDYKRIYLK